METYALTRSLKALPFDILRLFVKQGSNKSFTYNSKQRLFLKAYLIVQLKDTYFGAKNFEIQEQFFFIKYFQVLSDDP